MPTHWDLVAAAPWLEADKKEALDYFAKELKSRLDRQELLDLARIVFINEDDPKLKQVQRDIAVEHSMAELRDEEFFGMGMKRAYIITSKRESELSQNRPAQ